MTTHKFRKLYDANIYEMFWLQETIINNKLAKNKKLALERIKFLEKENKELDETYWNSLPYDEPHKYYKLKIEIG